MVIGRRQRKAEGRLWVPHGSWVPPRQRREGGWRKKMSIPTVSRDLAHQNWESFKASLTLHVGLWPENLEVHEPCVFLLCVAVVKKARMWMLFTQSPGLQDFFLQSCFPAGEPLALFLSPGAGLCSHLCRTSQDSSLPISPACRGPSDWQHNHRQVLPSSVLPFRVDS